MRKRFSSVIALVLAFVLLMPVLACAASDSDYSIVNPYSEVIWSGDNAWGAYKGNLHTHSFVSDAEVDYRDMILEYYNQGYDFLAMTDHGVTGKPWNEKPTALPLYFYQTIIGNKFFRTNEEKYTHKQVDRNDNLQI